MKYWRNTTPLWFEYAGFSPHLLCCGLRQETLPLCTGDVEIGATHSCVTADAHAGPGKAGVLTETALLNATEHDKGEFFFFVVASRKPSHWATVWKQDGWNVLKPFCWLSKCPNRLTAVQRGARKYDTVNCCHGFHLTDISTASQEADFFSFQLTFTAVITST